VTEGGREPRVVVCDFCARPLRDRAWDYPARDVDYGEPRIGPNTPEPVEGSTGSWLACLHCSLLIRRGDREALVRRGVERFVRVNPEWVPRMGGGRNIARAFRDVHDRFWTAREGPGVEIGAAQLSLIANDPAFIREERRP
jgi:hypothetical protein